MWGKLVQEARRAGPRKIAILAVLAAIAVIFAYGNNSTNDAASGRTLPRTALHHAPANARVQALIPRLALKQQR
ncbi:MAG TPA: hypothetical protein VG228_08785 [Solirubrobacteraceae bacterium]|jgi:cytochrome c-type biogenesis protein CcmH/NrfG|nr:hypothetical protein [Solirubrobacteraceae bacterium]